MPATCPSQPADTHGVVYTTRLLRRASPDKLPPPSAVTLLVVDWADRAPGWGERLAAWCSSAPSNARPRVALFGPHTDLESHAVARSAGLAPMWARSKLVMDPPALLVSPAPA